MIAAPLFVFCALFIVFFFTIGLRTSKVARLTALFLAFASALCGNWAPAVAATQTATSTTLAVTSGGAPATLVSAGSVVALTASVKAGATPLTVGQVNFCDALANYCTDVHVFGTAQLTSAGTATLKFRPGIGSHSYKAVFAGTNTYGSSPSRAASLTVTGTIGTLSTTTSISKSGSWGNYALTATVTETGNATPLTGAVSFQDTSYANAVLGTGTLGTAVSGLTWMKSQTLPVDQGAGSVASGDFNGDGIRDLVIVNPYANSISVLLGNGDGTFAPVTILKTGVSPFGIAVTDFNGDGNQDLAVVNSGQNTTAGSGVNSNNVGIFLGHGDGTFTPATASPATGSYPYSIAAADFNSDGVPDLAVTNEGDNTVTILLGSGDGTFTPAAVSPSAGNNPYALAVGDFNADGKPDLAIGSTETTITILLGSGDGTFVAVPGPAITGYGVSVAVGDFNGDGIQDLAVGNGDLIEPETTTIAIFFGKNDGTFTHGLADPVVYGNPVDLVTGDFNEDGKPDLIVAGGYAGSVTVLLGGGDGSFTPNILSPALFSWPLAITIDDFNGDGRADLAVANEYGYTVPVLLTQPTQTATAVTKVSIPNAGQHLVTANYPGDSNYRSSASTATLLWGTPPATTTTLTLNSAASPVTSVPSGTVVPLVATVQSGTAPVTAGSVNFCDASASSCSDNDLLGKAALNGNGTATLKLRPGVGSHSYKAVFQQDNSNAASVSSVVPLEVTGKYATATTIAQTGIPGAYSLTATVKGIVTSSAIPAPTGSVFFVDRTNNNFTLGAAAVSQGTAALGFSGSLLPMTVPAGFGVATADFNRDGIPDLAIGDANDSHTGLSILLGNGDGTFTAVTPNPVVGNYPYSVVAVDWNGDGIPDLAVGNVDDNTVSILLGKGDGTFTPKPNLNFTSAPKSLVSGDFNGDGVSDLAVVAGSSIFTFTGKGDGTFLQSPGELIGASYPQGIAVGDLNGDGNEDLVVANYNGNSIVTIFLGNGDGTFQPRAASGSGSDTVSVTIADFNRDGIPDLAVTNYSDDSVGILLGDGKGRFHTPVFYQLARFNLQSVKAADFNGDGILDLAVGSGYGGIAILTGNGDGTFAAPVYGDLNGLYPSGFIAVADFNGDGLPDVAAPDQTSSNVAVFLNQQSVTVTATLNNVNPSGPGPHIVEANYPGDGNFHASISGTTSLTSIVAVPVLSLASGTYTSVQTLTITEATPGATIFYSAYGTINTNGFVPYTAPIQLALGGFEFIQAYAAETGYQQSNTTTAAYTLNLPPAPAPVFSLVAGNYAGAQSVTISDSAPGATIYYTANGAPPTIYSTQYSGPVTVSSSQTLVASAIAPGYSLSTAVSAQYLIASSPASFIYTLAGNGFGGYFGDGDAAPLANLNQPSSSVVDSAGNLYIADSENNVIRKVAAGTGVITTIAGTGKAGYSGDNGAATSAQLSYPTGLSLDSAGDLYFADQGNNAVRVIASITGTITTVAGNGKAGFSGDDDAASNSELDFPSGTAVDTSGNLYIADTSNSRIREVIAKSGIITTVAGGGYFGYFGSGDGGPATAASLEVPSGIAVDTAGNLYIADSLHNAIRKVTASTGVISTVAGSTSSENTGFSPGYSGDGGPATSAQLYYPAAVIVDRSGNLYIADTFNYVVREVTSSDGIISTIAGSGPVAPCFGYAGDGGPATGAPLCDPYGVSIDASGNLYISDSGFNRIRIVTKAALPPSAVTAAPTITVPSGTYASPQAVTITDSTPGASIYLTTNGAAPTTLNPGYNGPINITGNVTIQAIAVAPGYLPSSSVSAAYTITSPPASVIHTVAGTGVSGIAGSGGPATSAQFSQIMAMTSDKAGDLFFTDIINNVVWMRSATNGNISIVAGNGTQGYSGDGGLATSAQLNYPSGIAVDTAGNLYISDSRNSVVREVVASTGMIQTFAGVYGQNGFFGNNGDGGSATSAYLGYPQGLAIDAAGNLYIADVYNNEVRMVSASTGIITSIAGNGSYGFSGEGGPAASATLGTPSTLAFDDSGNLYIGSHGIGRVCKLTAATGILTTVAGNGDSYGSSGDGGPATSAEVDPSGLALDHDGNLFISNYPGVVREVSAATGIITKAIGNGYPGYSGDGGSAAIAQLNSPQGIVFDASSNLYIADLGNYRVREISAPSATATPVISPAPGTYTSLQTATITDSSKGAIIYYTTDGTAPANTSNVYSGSIAISATTTLQAIAIVPGFAQSSIASAAYTIQLPVAPAITATPSATSITTAQAFTVVVALTGPTGSPTPTGSVTLSSGSYSANQNLVSGAATFNVPAGSLPLGANTLTATYTPDTASAIHYTSATQAATVNVTQAIGTAKPTVALTSSAATITDQQPVSVSVSVVGASGQSTPTGAVILTGGSYSAQQSLSSGATTFTIPAGSLSAGANTLTASYSGDITYAAASGTTTVTVAAVLAAAPNPAPVAPGASATATATFSAGSTYSGTLNLSCTLSASPAGAQSLPTCSLNPTSIAIATGSTASSVLTVKTIAAASSSALLSPQGQAWKALSGGGAVALAFLFAVPSWRRRKPFLIIALFGIAVSDMIGCGGGGGANPTPPPATPATTAGTYTFIVVGTDSSNTKITASTNVTVTVQ